MAYLNETVVLNFTGDYVCVITLRFNALLHNIDRYILYQSSSYKQDVRSKHRFGIKLGMSN